MSKQLLFTLITCLPISLGGCALVKKQPAGAEPVGDPLAASAQLVQHGRLGEAVALLEAGIARHADDEAYRAVLKNTRLRKQTHERKLRDKLLIEETVALQKELPIITRLARSDYANQPLQARLEQVQEQLKQKYRALSDCGWHQYTLDPKLADRCLTLALSLENDPQNQRLLDHMQKKKRKAQQAQEQKQLAMRQREWKSRNQKRMQKARKFYQSSRLNEARKQLNLVLEENPGDKEAVELLAALKNRLEGYLNNLLKAGDRLYREGEIEGAKATWQAAHNLDPNDPRAREKIERAQRVLENLDTLRKTQ